MDQQNINISTNTIWRTILIIIGIILLYFIRDILLMIFTALVLAAALDRPIDKLQKYKVPRTLSAIFIYLILFFVLALVLYLILPPLASEIKGLALNYPIYLENLIKWSQKPEMINLGEILKNLSERLASSGQALFGTIIDIFGGFISFLIIFFMALFLNIQEKGVKKFIYYLTPDEHRVYVLTLFDRIQQKMSGWLWARILISFVVAGLTFLGLYLLGIKYALTLGVLAGLLNFIPYLGSVIAAIPAILLALIESPLLALAVVALYFFINSVVETFFLSPLLMGKITGLNPVLLILVVLVGAKLAGILGLILAVPTAVIISVLIEEYIRNKKKQVGEVI